MICDRCSWPIGYGCTCRTDQVTAQARWAQVQRRHREAVARYWSNERKRRLRAEYERGRAS